MTAKTANRNWVTKMRKKQTYNVVTPFNPQKEKAVIPLMIGESAVVAICTLASIIIQAAQSHREGMSQENRDLADKLFLNGLQRADNVLGWIDKQIFGTQ